MGDEEDVRLGASEYELLIAIYETAAAVRMAKRHPDFAKSCGGLEYLERRHELAMQRWDDYWRDRSPRNRETCA
jgi:hypothetical protein